MKTVRAVVKNISIILLVASFAVSCSTDESEKDTNLETDMLTAQEVQLVLESDQLSVLPTNYYPNCF